MPPNTEDWTIVRITRNTEERLKLWAIMSVATPGDIIRMREYADAMGKDIMVRSVNEDGESILYRAAGLLSPEHLKVVIEMGGDVNKCNERGVSPLHALFLYTSNYASPAALEKAERKLAILLEAGADIDRYSYMYDSPIVLAFRRGVTHPVIVQLCEQLLMKGPDLNNHSLQDPTALCWLAKWTDDPRVLEHLLDCYPEQVPIDGVNYAGETAIFFSTPKMLPHFFNRNANLDIRNEKNQNAVDVQKELVDAETFAKWIAIWNIEKDRR